MRKLGRYLAACSVSVSVACASTQRDPASTAIVHVTVIPATGSAPITDATVVIRDGRIDAVGPSASTAVPPGATVIDGSGKYLMPGLIEMHSHVSKVRSSALGLFVANGVTTIRDLGGDHQELLQWRREVRAGTRLGPRMLIAGPYLESQRNIDRMRADPPEERIEPFERTRIGVSTPARAKEVIDSLAKLELDVFKIRTVQDRETYHAIVSAARAHAKDVVGHTNANSPEDVIAAGQRGVEHSWVFAMDSVPPARRAEIWRSVAAAGIGVVPTMVALTNSTFAEDSIVRRTLDDTAGVFDPRRPHLSWFVVHDWEEQYAERNPQVRAAWGNLYGSALRNLREMRDAGVTIMAGSDVAVLMIFPGSTLHDELVNFVDLLGMPPQEAIERATRIPAEWMKMSDSLGTIEPGKIADLVLLDANPLENIRNTRRIAAVVLGGRVYGQAGIDSILRAVRAAPDIRSNDWRR